MVDTIKSFGSGTLNTGNTPLTVKTHDGSTKGVLQSVSIQNDTDRRVTARFEMEDIAVAGAVLEAGESASISQIGAFMDVSEVLKITLPDSSPTSAHKLYYVDNARAFWELTPSLNAAGKIVYTRRLIDDTSIATAGHDDIYTYGVVDSAPTKLNFIASTNGYIYEYDSAADTLTKLGGYCGTGNSWYSYKQMAYFSPTEAKLILDTGSFSGYGVYNKVSGTTFDTPVNGYGDDVNQADGRSANFAGMHVDYLDGSSRYDVAAAGWKLDPYGNKYGTCIGTTDVTWTNNGTTTKLPMGRCWVYVDGVASNFMDMEGTQYHISPNSSATGTVPGSTTFHEKGYTTLATGSSPKANTCVALGENMVLTVEESNKWNDSTKLRVLDVKNFTDVTSLFDFANSDLPYLDCQPMSMVYIGKTSDLITPVGDVTFRTSGVEQT